MTSKTHRRYGSNVPGPLEARRRLGKRRMTAAMYCEPPQAPLFDIGNLFSFGRSNNKNQHEMQWLPPRPTSPRKQVVPPPLELSSPSAETLDARASAHLEPRQWTAQPQIESASESLLYDEAVPHESQLSRNTTVYAALPDHQFVLDFERNLGLESISAVKMLSISAQFADDLETRLSSNMISIETFEHYILQLPYLALKRYFDQADDPLIRDYLTVAKRSILLATWRGFQSCQHLQRPGTASAVLEILFAEDGIPVFGEQYMVDLVISTPKSRLDCIESHIWIKISETWVHRWSEFTREMSCESASSDTQACIISMSDSISCLAELLNHSAPTSKIISLNTLVLKVASAIRQNVRVQPYNQEHRLLSVACLLVLTKTARVAQPSLMATCEGLLTGVTTKAAGDTSIHEQLCYTLLEYWRTQAQQDTNVHGQSIGALDAFQTSDFAESSDDSPTICLVKAIDAMPRSHKESMLSTLFMFVCALPLPNNDILAYVSALAKPNITIPPTVLEQLFSSLPFENNYQTTLKALPHLHKLHKYYKHENTRLLIVADRIVDIIEHSTVNPTKLWYMLGLSNPRKVRRALSDAEVNIIIDMASAFARSSRFTSRGALRQIMHCMHLLNSSRRGNETYAPISRSLVHTALTKSMMQGHWPGFTKFHWILAQVERHEGEESRRVLESVVHLWYENHSKNLALQRRNEYAPKLGLW